MRQGRTVIKRFLMVAYIAKTLSMAADIASNERLFLTKINDGEIWVNRSVSNEQFTEQFKWHHADGSEEVVDTTVGPAASNPYWAIAGGFSDQNRIATVSSTASGHFEYKRFEKGAAGWMLSARAALDAPLLFKEINFVTIDSFQFITKHQHPDTFVITNEPRANDALYREVLKNGEPHTTPGFWLGTELKLPRQSSTPADPKLTPKSPATSTASPKPNNNPTDVIQTKPDIRTTTPWLVWFIIVGTALVLIWIIKKNRK